MVIECIIIRKRVNEEIIVCLYCLGGRPVSMQNFRLIVNIFLHGCGLHYNVLSGLSVKQEVKG